MTEIAPTSAADARDRIEKGALLIDVRSDAGRAASGEIDGATVVLKDEVEAFAAGLDKDREVVIFCGTTAGSGPVADWLDNAGFTAVSHVDGGFESLRDATQA
ncbi:rhodanese-related sulfurtransferase [Conyzicola lurida]|uniref:Rhodanese-related sulfurtransferase n=1 Tax=Conyzicola lurida TaxID=1172621 RepID=A0A841AKL5_9MICO|nr:rhodanese-like domain-containing protein [Conyzicola lurida]MBB5842203.1 rhodanese-related sulfurtransferase [Conyzicola lurida]